MIIKKILFLLFLLNLCDGLIVGLEPVSNILEMTVVIKKSVDDMGDNVIDPESNYDEKKLKKIIAILNRTHKEIEIVSKKFNVDVNMLDHLDQIAFRQEEYKAALQEFNTAVKEYSKITHEYLDAIDKAIKRAEDKSLRDQRMFFLNLAQAFIMINHLLGI